MCFTGELGVMRVFGREISSSQLTFDRGNDSASCTQDVHRVEALVFADDELQDSQQLSKTLVRRLMEAVLVLWKDRKCNSSRIL